MSADTPRLLILGAHPDDAEYHAGGLAAAYRQAGREVKIVSVTDGSAGHHELDRAQLAACRRLEAEAAGRVIGAEYVIWKNPDGELTPSLDLRLQIIAEMRAFGPDLVLTHRPCDYHPDHRAVGQAVQDASYMVTVPLVLPDLPALRKDPLVAYMADPFTRPAPLAADVLLDATPHRETILQMLACHASQVFGWLAYEVGQLKQVPADQAGRMAWLAQWYAEQVAWRGPRFGPMLAQAAGEDAAAAAELIEAYEISEYAGQADRERLAELFPGGVLRV